MRWGISFNIPAIHQSELWGLPPPSERETIQKWDGTQLINVLYHFQYAPQSWKEWQRVAGIKVQMQRRIKHLEFQEYDSFSIDGKIYTVSELGQYFKDFVKFPKPMFPGQKRKAYQKLCIHAKRLHYEGLLHVEQLIATSIRFNDIDPEGIGQTVKRAITSHRFALDHSDKWNRKLNEDELIMAHKKGAAKTHEIRRNKSEPKRVQAKNLRDDGMTFSEISSEIGVSLSTVKRWLK
jgi:hypothetical protein